jgi:hypothetical protein
VLVTRVGFSSLPAGAVVRLEASSGRFDVGDGDGLTDRQGPFRLSPLASANRLLTCENRVARNPGNLLHAVGIESFQLVNF